MNRSQTFISHSHRDKEFAQLLAERLRELDLSAWLDSEKIHVGDDILEHVGRGLATTDLLIFIISEASLQSEWCKRELNFVANREITEKKILIVPIVIDDTPITDLPWHLQGRSVAHVSADAKGADSAAESVLEILKLRYGQFDVSKAERTDFRQDPNIDKLIASVSLGDIQAAQVAAVEILRKTDTLGRNPTFDKLLTYVDSHGDIFWSAMATIESCVSLAPRLVDYSVLRKMASHKDFSVRSTAASICMDLANFAPDQVPVDILLKLSVFNEDWYVQAPANAALKTLVRSMPGVLRIFFSRLVSDDPEECAHSAAALRDIASEEPELLDRAELAQHLTRVRQVGNREAVEYLEAAIEEVRNSKAAKYYKYGL